MNMSDEEMNRWLLHLSILLLFLFPFLFFPSAPSEAKVVERIIAIVNDDIITKSELDSTLFNRQRELINVYKIDPKQLKERLDQESPQLLEQMIRNHLLLQEARKKKIDISEDDINQAISRIKKLQNINSDEEFETALSSEGYTLNSFREETKKRLMLERLMAQEITSKIEITDSDIEKFYLENREQLSGKENKDEKISLNDDEKAQIREFLFEKRLQEELNKYTSQLKEKAYIKIMLDEKNAK